MARRTAAPSRTEPMGPPPRLPRLTPALRHASSRMILDRVSGVRAAEVANGIPKRTFFEWVERGRGQTRQA